MTYEKPSNKAFAERPRVTEKEAREALLLPSNMIVHLLANDDGTFSLMGHIVCEYCDYCEEQGDCRGEYDAVAVAAKQNPYTEVKEYD